jgi:hypothetical protein
MANTELPSVTDYRKEIDLKFPRSLFPHDCRGCPSRASSSHDVILGKERLHFCSMRCLKSFFGEKK